MLTMKIHWICIAIYTFLLTPSRLANGLDEETICRGTPDPCSSYFYREYFHDGTFNPSREVLYSCFDSGCISARCSCTQDHDDWTDNGVIECTGNPPSCSAWSGDEKGCQNVAGCNWVDGPTTEPAEPPSPTLEPTYAPTSACERGFMVHEFPDVMGLQYADINGDGRMDRYGIHEGNPFWQEQNTDGSYTKHIIDSENDDVTSLVAADINGDNLLDLVYADSGSRLIFPDWHYWGSIGWYKNTGEGAFGEATKISTFQMYGARFLHVFDVDGDGLDDIIVNNEDQIFWFKSLGSGNFANGLDDLRNNKIGDKKKRIDSIQVADLNGDDKMDLFVSSYLWKTSWYINNGNGGFTEEIITESTACAYTAIADLNGDGLLDIICSVAFDVLVKIDWDATWYENKGDGTFAEHALVLDKREKGALLRTGGGPVEVADVDGDGLNDIFIGGNAYVPVNIVEGRGVIWFKNLGGGIFRGKFISTPDVYGGLAIRDENNDGVLDIVRRTHWLETISDCLGFSIEESSPPEIVASEQPTFLAEGGNFPATEHVEAPASPTALPASIVDLSTTGYMYSRESFNGWLTWRPEDDVDAAMAVFNNTEGIDSVQECASRCQELNALAGAWNTRDNTCFCYSKIVCKEPCIEEEGIEFSTVSFADFGFCEKSFCNEDYFYKGNENYCDEIVGYDDAACDATIAARSEKPTEAVVADANSSPRIWSFTFVIVLGMFNFCFLF